MTKTYPVKLSIGLRIDSVSPAHIRFRIFSNLIPEEQDHEQATRASMGGELVLRCEEFAPFLTRLSPDIISCQSLTWKFVLEYTGMLGVTTVLNLY